MNRAIELRVLGEGRILSTHRLTGNQITLGNTSLAEVPLQFPTVSRFHAEIVVVENQVEVRDLGSRNGTYLGANKLEPHRSTAWPSAASLRIGPYELRWQPEPTRTVSTFAEQRRLIEKLAEIYCSRTANQNRIEFTNSRLRPEIESCLQELDPEQKLGPNLRAALVNRVHHEFHGHGPLTEALDRSSCREVLVNPFDEVFVDLGDGLVRSQDSFFSPQSYMAWILRTAIACGRRLDLQNPICDATLSNGARFHAVLPPIAFGGPAVSIRRFGSAPMNESTAITQGWISPEKLELLKQGIATKKNIVISGGTSTGKTSLLNFLAQWIAPTERVITIEDTVELALNSTNHVQLQARVPNAEGIGTVSLRDLLRCALRMRPDRIIVGECRGAEVLDMLQALNTGHPGSLTTVHANSPPEALHRLELLALLGAPNLSATSIARWIRQSVDWVVQVEREPSGQRRVALISEIVDNELRTLG